MRVSWVLILLLPAVALEGCVCQTSGVNRGDINIMSLDEEWQVGRELAQQISQQAAVVEDEELRSYVQHLGEEIVENTELNHREWEFHVIADSSVNAFNIPGGHVYVHTGLIEAASAPAELAGVIAHEVAHGVARHGTERLTKAYGLNTIARLVIGEEAGLLEQIAAQVLGSGAMAKFSRDDEREADRLGLEYMAETGYEPNGMATMFETMLQLRQRRPSMVERFFLDPSAYGGAHRVRLAARRDNERRRGGGSGGVSPRAETRSTVRRLDLNETSYAHRPRFVSWRGPLGDSRDSADFGWGGASVSRGGGRRIPGEDVPVAGRRGVRRCHNRRSHR